MTEHESVVKDVDIDEEAFEKEAKALTDEGLIAPQEVRELVEYKFKEEAKSKVIKAGLYFPGKPAIAEELIQGNDKVGLPEDMTKVTDDELGHYLSVFTALSAYAEGVVSVADIDWTTADRVATFAERLEIMKLPKEMQKNEDLRYGAVNRIKYVRELRRKEMEALATFKLSGGMLRAYEKAIASISREITRRANTFRHSNLEDNLGRRHQRD